MPVKRDDVDVSGDANGNITLGGLNPARRRELDAGAGCESKTVRWLVHCGRAGMMLVTVVMRVAEIALV
ncbi:MAG: hypothetical protein ACOCWF_08220 [Halochromatium sp.]|uniref:hypothetical protein n=1 Tax=Halochromatium sp. TaxID=2049430 RepID=UPI00397E84BD